MNKEIITLEANNTWTLVDLPPGKKTIWCKWVYKVKLKSDGSLERCKSRNWHEKLMAELLDQGFHQSKNDYNLFIHKDTLDITNVAVYVDDITVTGSNLTRIDALKCYLDMKFSIKDLGLLNYFLGLEISYLPTGIVLS
ncbi:hypothetical protein AgCh_036185 [Apium graveolens]